MDILKPMVFGVSFFRLNPNPQTALRKWWDRRAQLGVLGRAGWGWG
jgi:hypothetical protein